MSVDLVIRCNGTDTSLPVGVAPCRRTFTAEGATLLAQARHEAALRGWTVRLHTGGTDLGALPAATEQDLCPLCHGAALAQAIDATPAAQDTHRCFTCGRTEATHNVRHPFRRWTPGGPMTLLRADLARAQETR